MIIKINFRGKTLEINDSDYITSLILKNTKCLTLSYKGNNENRDDSSVLSKQNFCSPSLFENFQNHECMPIFLSSTFVCLYCNFHRSYLFYSVIYTDWFFLTLHKFACHPCTEAVLIFSVSSQV